MADNNGSRGWFGLAIALTRVVCVPIALALLANCQITCANNVPANVRDNFLDVAQRRRSFPPGRLFFGPRETGAGMDWYPGDVRVSAPGAAEYRALLQSNQPVPILRALLKDSDPKI